MNNIKIFMIAALLCGALSLVGCTGGSTTTTPNSSNTASKPADSPKTQTKTETPKTEPASADSVGVPECDEYIKKYEACLTKIAEKAPQVQPQLKTSFEQQRNGFKQAASTAEGKSMLATQCKQFIESAKQSTSAYACTW